MVFYRLEKVYIVFCAVLRCSTWDLLAAVCKLLVATRGLQFPDQGSNPGPLHWEHGVLATGQPVKSQGLVLNELGIITVVTSQ